MTPRFTTEEVAELLGAYALDACSDEEVVAVEAVLAEHAELAGEARRLAQAASWIGMAHAIVPPPALRDRVVAAARPIGADAALDAYVDLSGALNAVIEGLSEQDLTRPTANGLTVGELVVHLAAQESLVALEAGVPVGPALVETDIDTRTAELLRELAGRPVGDAAAIWRDAVGATSTWARAHADASVTWRGAAMSRDDVLVVHAFETWTHTDDLRAATGRPLEAPTGAQLGVMSEFASRVLALSLALAGCQHPGATARLVLTGAGGGDWTIALDDQPPGEPDVVLTADVVDWCRRVADRISPSDLRCSVRGDERVAADLVAAASALATL